jgi:hypothetical protein
MKGSFVLPAICVAALAIICALWIIGSVFISPVYLLGNLRAIAVYGRVLDQDALPVGDVEVYGGVLLNLGWERSGSRVYSTKTDEKGFFEFTGLHGERLGLKMQKPGYEYNPNLTAIPYGVGNGDPGGNPRGRAEGSVTERDAGYLVR